MNKCFYWFGRLTSIILQKISQIGILIGNSKPVLEMEEEKLLTQPEAIKFLKKSRQTLIKWRKKEIITSYRLGGRIYFKESELINALEKLCTK